MSSAKQPKVYQVKLHKAVLFVAGVWCIADGVGSIILFRGQPRLDQIPRGIRILAGLVVEYVTWKWVP